MKYKIYFLSTLFLIALLTPIIVYVFTFGLNISLNHTRWAEFGSVIGGIYSPVIAILTLVILSIQIDLQKEVNKHEFDQSYIQQARLDIEFFAIQISNAINIMAIPEKTFKMVLFENFLVINQPMLNSLELRHKALEIHLFNSQLFNLWNAIYPIFEGLAVTEEPAYKMAHTASSQKLIAILSYESCVALDNFHKIMCENRLNFKYLFSSVT